MSFGQRLSVVVVVSVAVGVVSELESALGVSAAIVAVAVGTAIGWDRCVPARWCLWVVMGTLAAAFGAHAREGALARGPTWTSSEDTVIVIEGHLRRDASVGESGVRLELDAVHPPGHHEASRGPLTVLAIVGGDIAPGLASHWTAGRRVTMPARFRVPANVRNPGSPSVRWQQLTRPFDVTATVKSGLLVTVEPGAVWQEAASAVRRHVRDVCRKWLAPLNEQSAAVVTAILIGDRAGLDETVTRRLQVAGTFHVIAISGGNVAILTALCLFFFRLILRHDRAPVVATLFVVLAYGLIVGRDASVMRAVVAATLYLSLRLVGVVPHPLNVLALTAVVCVGLDPLVVLDVGAWLSFGATLGLIAVLPQLSGEDPAPPGRAAWRAVWRPVRGLFLATVAAEIVILPVAASVFMRVGAAGLVLNFVAIPAMAVVQVSGLLLCALALCSPWSDGVAAVVAMVGHLATSTLLGSAELVDYAPWLVRRVPAPPMAWITAYYAAVVLAVTWSGRRVVKRAAIVVAVSCACGVVLAPWTSARRPASGWARITMIDVGQGEAVALQLPGGHAILVDAGGSAGRFDVGGRIVTPALWALGIRRLDWLLVTHGDVDHAGGARRVTEDLRPREIWEGVPVPSNLLMRELQRAARGAGIAWRRLQSGDQLELGGVVVDVVHPPVPDWERQEVRNDDSVVLRVRFGLVELLLTGDVGAEFESAVPSGDRRPPIRILKVGHHGSATSSQEQFLDQYGPVLALVSAGQGNLFGHPAPVVTERLRQRGVDLFRTDRDGAIVIETDGRQVRLRTATGRSLTVRARAMTEGAVPVSPVAMPLPSLPWWRYARTLFGAPGRLLLR